LIYIKGGNACFLPGVGAGARRVKHAALTLEKNSSPGNISKEREITFRKN
jgi:hypothetical protein